MPNENLKEINKHFEFDAKIIKAYFNKETGKYYVTAIASDTGVDHHRERFSEKALDGMITNINTKSPAEVLFLPTHWDTFEIGKVTSGRKTDSPFSSELKAMEVEIELNMDYAESKALYKEVESGNAEKQLSVGGYLNPDSEKSYYWEEKEYETEDGNKLYDYILVLDDIILDHIAATRKDKAANGRTSFTSAIAKSLGLEKPINKKKEEIEMANSTKVDKQAEGLISAISKSIQNFFASNNEDNQRIEKAKKASEELLEVINYYKSSEIPKEIKNIMKEISKCDSEAVNETSTEEVKTSNEVVETNNTEVSQTNEVSEVEENSEKSTLNVSELKSSIIEDVTKSVMESNKLFFEEISKSLGMVIGETIKSQIAPINEKINSIEKSAGISKGIDGQEKIESKEVEKSNKETQESDVWSGIIKSALPKEFFNRKYNESEEK